MRYPPDWSMSEAIWKYEYQLITIYGACSSADGFGSGQTEEGGLRYFIPDKKVTSVRMRVCYGNSMKRVSGTVLLGISSQTWVTYKKMILIGCFSILTSMAEGFVFLSRTIQHSGRVQGRVSWFFGRFIAKWKGREGR